MRQKQVLESIGRTPPLGYLNNMALTDARERSVAHHAWGSLGRTAHIGRSREQAGVRARSVGAARRKRKALWLV